MAKDGIRRSQLTPVLLNKAKSGGWTLCIGAGTSYPMFPTWKHLVYDFVQRDASPTVADEIVGRLVESFGLDALIQAARDRLALPPEKFASALSKALYGNVKKELTATQWKLFKRALEAHHIGNMRLETWADFGKLMKSRFPHISAMSIADVVAESATRGTPPAAIISFNAEPTLYALIHMQFARRALAARAKGAVAQDQKAVLDRVTRSVSQRNPSRIPFVFCHGLLPIDDDSSSAMSAVDKLVFSESEYLQIANTGFSWQSAIFFEACMSRSVVFIGLSFSDPNLRRWLGIMHQNRLRELVCIGADVQDSAPHYWVRTKPISKEETRWIESTVAHLGVRLVWLDDWSEVGEALAVMLGLPDSS